MVRATGCAVLCASFSVDEDDACLTRAGGWMKKADVMMNCSVAGGILPPNPGFPVALFLWWASGEYVVFGMGPPISRGTNSLLGRALDLRRMPRFEYVG
ncbi:hypothetical protein U1Q18_040475 [Sarracenia purpurea var. burkii]